eukprot:c48023_g1_i1 orf=2-211(-)
MREERNNEPIKMWSEKGDKEGVVKVHIDQDQLTSINEYHEKHYLIMHFVGWVPLDSMLHSWMRGQWVGRG